MSEKKNLWPQLVTMICDALESMGYGVIESIELWNTEYKPMIKALPNGRHTIQIGKTEISFTLKHFEQKEN